MKPKYKTKLAAGFDFYANEKSIIFQNDWSLIGTGVYVSDLIDTSLINMKDRVPYIAIKGRSGLAIKGLFAFEGTIDADYEDEIKILIENRGTDIITVEPGDRIAQGIIMLSERLGLVEIEDSEREGGFGSTGEEG